MKFDLKFEIADVKNLVKILGETFLLAKQVLEISDRISEQISGKFSGTLFQISCLFSEPSFSRRAVLTIYFLKLAHSSSAKALA